MPPRKPRHLHPALPLLAALCLTPPLVWLAPAQAADLLSRLPLPTYTLTDLGVLPGHDNSAGTAINLLGEAVGYSYTLPGLKRAFLYREGQLIDLGARVSPPGYSSLALAINVKGQVVGVSFPVNSPAFTGVGFVHSGGRGVETFMAPGCSYTEATGINSFGQIVGHGYVTLGPTGPAVQQRAFLRQPNGAITNLDIFGSTWAAANAVNDWGQVVGFYLDSHGAYHGFLTQPGGATPKDLGTFLVRGEPLAVNDLGQVVGYTTVIGESGLYYSQAFLYAQGKMHELGTSSGYSSSIAYGINNRGQVVGSAGTLSPPRLVVWVYLQGQMRDLNGLLSPAARGWTVEGASGINDLGQIIGTATFNNGNPHAVILTPRYW